MKTTIKTTQDILALGFSNDYHTKEGMQKLELCQQVQEFHPCELECYYNHGNCSWTLWIDKEKQITINKDCRANFSIYAIFHRSNINYDGMKRQIEDIKKPNNFKKLNKKIIEKWIAYELECRSSYEKFATECTIKHAEFMQKVDKLQKQGLKLKIWEDSKHGYLENDYFTLSFELCVNGYISQNIRLNRQAYDIEDFEVLTKLK